MLNLGARTVDLAVGVGVPKPGAVLASGGAIEGVPTAQGEGEAAPVLDNVENRGAVTTRDDPGLVAVTGVFEPISTLADGVEDEVRDRIGFNTVGRSLPFVTLLLLGRAALALPGCFAVPADAPPLLVRSTVNFNDPVN